MQAKKVQFENLTVFALYGKITGKYVFKKMG